MLGNLVLMAVTSWVSAAPPLKLCPFGAEAQKPIHFVMVRSSSCALGRECSSRPVANFEHSRTAEQVALQHVHAHFCQAIGLFLCLHPFSHNCEVEEMAGLRKEANDR